MPAGYSETPLAKKLNLRDDQRVWFHAMPESVLVDTKVCAVDETWSGLKLVIRKDLR